MQASARTGRARAATSRRVLDMSHPSVRSTRVVKRAASSSNGNGASAPAAAAMTTPPLTTSMPRGWGAPQDLAAAPERMTTATATRVVEAPPPPTATTAPPPSPISQQPTPPTADAAAAPQIAAAKLALLDAVAPLDRGALATAADKANVERLVAALEALGERAAVNGATTPLAPLAAAPGAAPSSFLDGRWQLVYANTQAFRASPFFAAFADGFVRDRALAEAIFAFTDAIPGATIGAAYQTVSLAAGSLVSAVDLAVFPGLRGSVVTTSRLEAAPPRTLRLTVESTRVEGSSVLAPLLDAVSVPVEGVIEALRGRGATRVEYDITYCDAALRVTRTPGGQLLVHRRVL